MAEIYIEAVEFRRLSADAYERDRMGPIMTYSCPLAWDNGYGAFLVEWDYQISWKLGERPKVLLLEYRSYRAGDKPGVLQLVERKIEDIPITEGILIGISNHASGQIFANSDIQGSWCEAEGYFMQGIEQAVRQRYDLANYRLDAQRRFKEMGGGSQRD